MRVRGVDYGGECGRDIVLLKTLERLVVDRRRHCGSTVLSGIHGNKGQCIWAGDTIRLRDDSSPPLKERDESQGESSEAKRRVYRSRLLYLSF